MSEFSSSTGSYPEDPIWNAFCDQQKHIEAVPVYLRALAIDDLKGRVALLERRLDEAEQVDSLKIDSFVTLSH